MSRNAKIVVGIIFTPLGVFWLARHWGAGKRPAIAFAVGYSVLGIILLAALPSNSTKKASPNASPKTTTQSVAEPPPPPPGPSEKAVKAREHGQAFYNAAQACVVSFVAAAQSKTDVAGADNFLAAKDLCENTRSILADKSQFNTDDIDDQTVTLWAAVDEAKQGSNSALNYIDTLAPSKLADFKKHVRNAAGYLAQGKRELNARLRELGARPIRS